MKMFIQNGSLKIHVLTVHQQRKDFECKDCEMKFGQNGNLVRHINFVHQKWNRVRMPIMLKEIPGKEKFEMASQKQQIDIEKIFIF